MSADLYKELGVPRNADAEEIKKAYRKLAAELHPDKNPGNAAVEARFKAVNRAYHVLTDHNKRALYDEFGEDGLREGFRPDVMRAYRRQNGGRVAVGGGNAGFEDVFSKGGGLGDLMGDLFGGRAAGRRRGHSRGADLASDVTVDFGDAIRGITVTVKQHGSTEDVKVRIPPGAGDGDRVRVAGHGSPGRGGGEPGDLLITVRVRPHPFFERNGLDLRLDLPITVAESYRGAKVSIPTPDGVVGLKVPKHAQSGQMVRLKGRGVRRKDQVGDLLVRFMIRVPNSESTEAERAIDALSDSIADSVRANLAL
jgi:curved DNA-binding protein